MAVAKTKEVITAPVEKSMVEVEGILLPNKKIPAASTSPRNLVIFSKPKAGKTTLLADLPDSLILDLNKGGSDFVDAVKIKASSHEEILAIGRAIKANGFPYKVVCIDTGTDLEEIAMVFAEQLYSATPMGASWFEEGGGKEKYGTITNMPNGAGYMWVREAYMKLLNYIRKWAPRTILTCHVKDVLLEKNSTQVSALDLDLTGKLKTIVCSDSDAIGYMYRKGNQNILSFKTADQVNCGARAEHLRNKEIVVSEMDEATGKITTYWDRIFID